MSNELTVVQHQEAQMVVPHAFAFSESERKIILDTCCGGASESDARALLAIAEARGMNPLRQECYFVCRQGKWAVQASIDSFRMKAEQTGEYHGQDEPEYELDDKGAIVLCRVRVYRKGWPRPSVGVAYWKEYAQESSPTWKRMPRVMIAKCAEAIAFRKGFPAVFAKVYTPEEMDQAGDATPAPQAKKLTPPPVNETESGALRETLAAAIIGAATTDELAKAIAEATKAKPRLSKEDQKILAKHFRDSEKRLIAQSEVVAADAEVVA